MCNMYLAWPSKPKRFAMNITKLEVMESPLKALALEEKCISLHGFVSASSITACD